MTEISLERLEQAVEYQEELAGIARRAKKVAFDDVVKGLQEGRCPDWSRSAEMHRLEAVVRLHDVVESYTHRLHEEGATGPWAACYLVAMKSMVKEVEDELLMGSRASRSTSVFSNAIEDAEWDGKKAWLRDARTFVRHCEG